MKAVKNILMALLVTTLGLGSMTAAADDWDVKPKFRIAKDWDGFKIQLIDDDDDDDDDDYFDRRRKSGYSSNRTPITMQQAINIAERRTGGRATEVELENKGKRNSYYEVETKRGSREYEVKIDAYTGRILEVEIDD